MRRPGIEPGPPAWQARIVPLNHRRCEFKQIRFYLKWLLFGINISICSIWSFGSTTTFVFRMIILKSKLEIYFQILFLFWYLLAITKITLLNYYTYYNQNIVRILKILIKFYELFLCPNGFNFKYSLLHYELFYLQHNQTLQYDQLFHRIMTHFFYSNINTT